MNDGESVGFDPGAGAIKLAGQGWALSMVSTVASDAGRQTAPMFGLSRRQPPMRVVTADGGFFVGPDAHAWGRPVEALDYTRLSGTPEMRALLYGALTQRIRQAGGFAGSVRLTVGLPLEAMADARAQTAADSCRRWLAGRHAWLADGEAYEVVVSDVRATSQPAAAFFDYVLDDNGSIPPMLKPIVTREIGVLSIGFSTIELLVVKDRAPVARFSAGSMSGVRRLLEIMPCAAGYTAGELDAMLRAGALDLSTAASVWEREVYGAIDRTWGTAWRRFALVLAVGGGAILLRDSLTRQFQAKLVVPENPVLSIARGLHKIGSARNRRS